MYRMSVIDLFSVGYQRKKKRRDGCWARVKEKVSKGYYKKNFSHQKNLITAKGRRLDLANHDVNVTHLYIISHY